MSCCSQDAVRIQAEDFSQEEEIRALRASSNGIGGIVTFLGCARDFSEGREVSQISFDAYERMLLPELHKLRDEAMARFKLIDARIVHRLGTLQAGEQIVLIAAAAAHRGPAFDACRWIIDEVKARIPIWKHERYAGGDAGWLHPEP